MTVQNYRTQWFSNLGDARRDVLAGIVVALALIPEAIGFSIISGVDPRVGLYASVAIAIVISCIFHYYWLHMQSVHQFETNLMTQQRIKIMISQIQPHFLCNTIATFRALCKKDPDKAAQVAEKFGLYLRQNLDSLNSENLIPFEKEIGHTKIYADIEMVRFENVRVEYDIQDTDFLLPPLTVQPMVENAIRHGVRIRQEGVVSVSTFLSDNSHVIVIRDNGIGFDESKIDRSDGKHIGIQNLKERMEKLCGGTLTIESVPDEGTTVTIRIPAEAKHESDLYRRRAHRLGKS